MTEMLSSRLYDTVCTQILLLTLSVLRNNDAVVSVGQAPLRQDDGSAKRATLHRRACKHWLYWRSSSRCLIDCLSLLKLPYRLLVRGSGVRQSRQISLEERDVSQLHVAFQTKLADFQVKLDSGTNLLEHLLTKTRS
uniref:Uncharacterized protein n=1 Tax=Cucumis melo TaxID=3656 RepID=A0A9I9EEB0_CUCME